MASSLVFKVYDPNGVYVAGCAHAEDAAAVAARIGDGTTVRYQHSPVVWREGSETFRAATGYTAAANVMRNRVRERHRAQYERLRPTYVE